MASGVGEHRLQPVLQPEGPWSPHPVPSLQLLHPCTVVFL